MTKYILEEIEIVGIQSPYSDETELVRLEYQPSGETGYLEVPRGKTTKDRQRIRIRACATFLDQLKKRTIVLDPPGRSRDLKVLVSEIQERIEASTSPRSK